MIFRSDAARRLRGFLAFILTLLSVMKDGVNEHSFILHELPHFGKRGENLNHEGHEEHEGKGT
ncbi:MAG: hypothetical protein DRJ61_10790 [Acidobacteria bacterium]|nr:MAG: hypothetical protein DRJ65_17385 [Acidobacteriota bacterium]RLE31808.1 MAG: hypothetical protein DRJ61_10790 [Acidobacteriota bacterium]